DLQAEVAFRRQAAGQPTPRTIGGFVDGHLVGTLHTFPTELTLPGGTHVRSDAITNAAVLPTHTRRGVLRAMLTHDLRVAKEHGEVASVLIAAEYPIYGRFGYGPATEHVTYAVDVQAAEFTHAAPGHVELIERDAMRKLAPVVFDAFRQDRPGQIARDDFFWGMRTGTQPAPWGT